MIDHRGYTHIVKLKPEKNSPGDQFTVGLIAQLVEHCTGIAEVGIPFRPEFFFRL